MSEELATEIQRALDEVRADILGTDFSASVSNGDFSSQMPCELSKKLLSYNIAAMMMDNLEQEPVRDEIRLHGNVASFTVRSKQRIHVISSETKRSDRVSGESTNPHGENNTIALPDEAIGEDCVVLAKYIVFHGNKLHISDIFLYKAQELVCECSNART